jgi:uncharacterized protein (DUF3084 family)
MASLENTKIKDTYKSLLKTNDNQEVTGEVEITDGKGNLTGVKISNDGSLKSTTLETSGLATANSLSVTAESTLTGSVTVESEMSMSTNKITNVVDPTADQDAATKKYVDDKITAEDLDFTGNAGTGDVDLDSESFEITGSNGITTTALDNTLDIDGSALETAINTNTGNITTNTSNISTNTSNISNNATSISNNADDIDANETAIAGNTSNISSNATNIATNTSNITTNTGNVATNTANISTNTSDIATNTADIATNSAGISTNASGISSNASSISANTTAIQSNDTDIATNTTDIATNASDIAGNTTDIATNTSGIATNVTNIATNAANITSNDTDITALDGRVTANEGDITTNASGIATNVSDISTNAGDISTNATNIANNDTDIGTLQTAVATNTSNISTNAGNISTNASGISTNATNIASNDSDISTLQTDVAANTTNISTNATNIASNDTDIATNASNISTNATNIASNDTDIATNTSNISTNTSNISANTSAIANKVSKSGDTMSGDLTISTIDPDLTINTSGPYLNSKIKFTAGAVSPIELFEILAKSNPVFYGLAFRASNGTSMADSFIVHSDYNYTPLPLRVGANASANELDDFEEGDANLTFGLAYYQPGSNIAFYSGTDFSSWSDNSRYVKVGSSVTVYIDITFSNSSASPTSWLSGSHATWLGGLPFSVAGSYTSDYNKTSPLHGDYGFGINMQTYNTDNDFQIRPYKWGTYGMYFGFTSNNVQSKTSPLRNDAFNYSIGYSNYGVRQITGVIHYRTTQ